MGIHVDWGNDDHNTISVSYERSWSWTDFADAKVQIDSLLNSVEYTVDILSDSSQSGGLPGGNALSVLARSFQSAPSNIGKVVVVGANPFFKSLLQILQTVSLNRAANNIHFAKSSDEARSLIKLASSIRLSSS
ncbi:MAG: hypothetical protein LCI00_28075 [Chloroflexi bacterium]|nr:hypothetical protein [Chloroflexota bacterium]MCC6893895.1 hypothetical protein [Anaerolineae bacterium]